VEEIAGVIETNILAREVEFWKRIEILELNNE